MNRRTLLFGGAAGAMELGALLRLHNLDATERVAQYYALAQSLGQDMRIRI